LPWNRSVVQGGRKGHKGPVPGLVKRKAQKKPGGPKGDVVGRGSEGEINAKKQGNAKTPEKGEEKGKWALSQQPKQQMKRKKNLLGRSGKEKSQTSGGKKTEASHKRKGRSNSAAPSPMGQKSPIRGGK